MTFPQVQSLVLIVGLTACGYGQSLVLKERVDKLDVRAREPMVVQHPGGAIFVAGYGDPGPKLWKSSDRGKTWVRLDVGGASDGAMGNSDVDLAVAPEGTLYFLNLSYDRTRHEGLRVDCGVSRDGGTTWKWSALSQHRFDDRPWIKISPTGAAHVIWNDGEGVNYAVSRDHGETWQRGPRIHDKGGSSHLAVGPKRTVAVRVTPSSAGGSKFHEGVDLVAVSTNDGATWKRYPAPGHRTWKAEYSSPDRWVEPLARDARGALYSFWTEDNELWLARTTNQGKTWKSWKVATSSELPYYPYLIARGNGELAATWFSGEGDKLQAHVARINVQGANPKFIEAAPFVPESFSRQGTDPQAQTTRSSAGEYLPVLFLKSGGVAVVSPIQHPQENREGFTWWRFEEQ